MNSAVGPKKQTKATETGMKSMHCSRGVNADADMGQISAIQMLTKSSANDCFCISL